MPKKGTRRHSGTRTASRSKSTEAPAGVAGLPAAASNAPGATLVALILEARSARGLTYPELAEKHLGISRSHLLMLRSGQRAISNVSDEVMGRIAKFLGLPKVVAMLAGGQLRLEDFYQKPEMVREGLEPALKFIQRDPDVGPYMPPGVFVADEALQRFILLLYEKATGKTLIPSRVSLTDVVESYKTLLHDA
jgi:transcriptional regulator with XRE-family HTH domain